jgi:hypothetical protein
MNKHISTFEKFIFEQDLGMGFPPTQPTSAPKKEKPFQFLFIEPEFKGALKQKKYPDGSILVEYSSYLISKEDLENWAKKNIVGSDEMTESEAEVKRENIMNIVSGKKINLADSDMPFLEKLKTACHTGIVAKKSHDIPIIFTKSGSPTAEDVDATFINLR